MTFVHTLPTDFAFESGATFPKDYNRIIIHHDDTDGYMAAGIAASAFGGKMHIYPTTYGRPFPFDPSQLTKNHELFILDFSYPATVLEYLNERVKKLVVLDHHEGMRDEIAHLPYVTFNTDFSGAGLAWHYIVGEEVPFTEAVNLVDAYDLWDKNRPGYPWENVVKYHLGTEEHRSSLDFWANAAAQLFVPPEIMDLGTERFNELRAIAKDREEASHIEQIQDVRFALFKAPAKWHSLVHDLVKESAGVDMTVSYAIDIKTKKLVFNVRSNVNSKITALQLAKSLGGGGHPQAAGFSQPKHVDPLTTLTTALKDLQK